MRRVCDELTGDELTVWRDDCVTSWLVAILAAPALIYSTHRLLVVWIIVVHFHLCSLLDRYTALEVLTVQRPMRICCGSRRGRCVLFTNILGITDFSYPRPFVPKNERSLWRTFVPRERSRNESSRNFRSGHLSFPGTFVVGNFRSRRTKVPGNVRSWDLSYPGTKAHYPIGLVAAMLCVLNYCMFGYDFTLMMLTPLWTSQLTLYAGRPAFAARLFVFVCQLASSRLFALHFYLTEKNNTNTP